MPCLGSCDTFVQSTVVRVSAGYVEMGDHVAVHRHVLANLKPFRVGQTFAVEFPGDLGGRLTVSNAIQEHARSRLKRLLGECLANLRGFDCGCEKYLRSKLPPFKWKRVI